jgi:hypothetical protein
MWEEWPLGKVCFARQGGGSYWLARRMERAGIYNEGQSQQTLV